MSFRGRCVALLVLLALATAAPACAQDCRVDSRAEMDFGTFERHGGQVSVSLPFSCANSSGRPLAFAVCLFVGGSATPGGHRRMVNERGEELAFDLYSDPAGTQPIGLPGSGYPVHAATLRTAGNGRVAGTIRVYGRIPPSQFVSATSAFRSSIDDAYIRYAAAAGEEPPTAEECEDGARDRTAPMHFEITAAAANDCQVLVADDLDFGAVFQLNEKRDQDSTIAFTCPKGTAWRVGLDDGLHFNGEFRGMQGPGGIIAYDLYQNPGRTLRWGDLSGDNYEEGKGKDGVETLTVHGRVRVQTTPAQGVYTDTITVTLIF